MPCGDQSGSRRIGTRHVEFVRNARDAMPSGGVITYAHRMPPRFVTGSFRAIRVVTVEDTVPGCRRGAHAYFSPSSPPRDRQGSGLGCPRSMDSYSSRGRVRVASTVGRGTTVTLFLPVPMSRRRIRIRRGGSCRRRQTPRRRRFGSAGGGRRRSRHSGHGDAAGVGYGVTRAASAESALGALANERHVDLVLSES